MVDAPVADDLDAAVAWLAGGGLLAYPTETVWGLGADARSTDAVARLRAFKERGDAAPISILVSGIDAVAGLGLRAGAPARRLAGHFWPGPLTLVLPGEVALAPGVARRDGAVGVRCSSHPGARALAVACARAGVGPLTATSCNRSGESAATTRAEAEAVCGSGGAAPHLLRVPDSHASESPGSVPACGSASTVVDLTGERPIVLRWGALGSEQLSPIIEELAAA